MKRSKFSLSNYKLLSCDMGELVPCGITEVLPGDTIQQATSVLLRSQPLFAPVMHPVHVRMHHWYVPFRLLWDDWEDFITGGEDGMDASVFPTVDMGAGATVGSLADYLGVPTGVAGLDVSALPFRAYAMIWNEWYCDQDLQAELVIDTTSGVDSTTSVLLQNIAWEKDYFTSARPWEQKGPAITIPLGTSAPVKGIGAENQVYDATDATVFESGGSSSVVYADKKSPAAATANDQFFIRQDPANAGFPGIYADLTGVSAVTINVLREAMALQRFEEARARFGSRYTEYLRYLGVRSSDARLQRPEYLGGGKQTIQFSEVLQTTRGTAGGGPL